MTYQLIQFGRFTYSDLMGMYVMEFKEFYKLLDEDYAERVRLKEENNKK